MMLQANKRRQIAQRKACELEETRADRKELIHEDKLGPEAHERKSILWIQTLVPSNQLYNLECGPPSLALGFLMCRT